MGEGIDDRQALDDMAVLKVLGEEVGASEVEGGGEEEAVPPGKAVSSAEIACTSCSFHFDGGRAKIGKDIHLIKGIRIVKSMCFPQKNVGDLVQNLQIGESDVPLRQGKQPLAARSFSS